MVKGIFIIIFILIIVSLGSALWHVIKHKSDADSQKTLKALTFRIGLSIGLFLLLILALASGLIKPHGIGTRIHSTSPASPASNPEVLK